MRTTALQIPEISKTCNAFLYGITIIEFKFQTCHIDKASNSCNASLHGLMVVEKLAVSVPDPLGDPDVLSLLLVLPLSLRDQVTQLLADMPAGVLMPAVPSRQLFIPIESSEGCY